MQLPQSPFKILALGPFHMNPNDIWSQAPLTVDRQSIDESMQAMQIGCFLPLPSDICPEGGLDLRFSTIKSLHPDGVVQKHDFFNHLKSAADFISESRKNGLTPDRIINELRLRWPDLPPIKVKDAAPRQRARRKAGALDNLLDMVALPDQAQDQAPVFKEEKDEINALFQKALAALFSLPGFRRMEAAWRGLRLMLQQGVTDNEVKIEIVPVHAERLEATIDNLAPLVIHQLPSAILLDLPFDNSPLAMERLAYVAQWASSMMVPVIAWSPASLLQIQSWSELPTLPFIPHHMEGGPYAKYRKLRESAEGNWIALTCNRFLVRYPYGPDNKPRKAPFVEKALPWISPVWAAGTLIAKSVCRTGWPTHLTHIRQVHLEDLAMHTPLNHPPMAVETLIDRDRLDQLHRTGLSPLGAEGGRDTAFLSKAVCLSGHSLTHQLLACRVTQFLLWCKDNLPSETNPEALQAQLRLAFQVMSEQTQPSGFESMDISTGQPNDQGRIPVHIAVTPSSTVLPSRQPIEMDLDW